MTSLFKCHCCNAITDNSSKDKRFKENTCISCGDKQKKEEDQLVIFIILNIYDNCRGVNLLHRHHSLLVN